MPLLALVTVGEELALPAEGELLMTVELEDWLAELLVGVVALDELWLLPCAL